MPIGHYKQTRAADDSVAAQLARRKAEIVDEQIAIARVGQRTHAARERLFGPPAPAMAPDGKMDGEQVGVHILWLIGLRLLANQERRERFASVNQARNPSEALRGSRVQWHNHPRIARVSPGRPD